MEDSYGLRPTSQLFKFNDPTTAVQFRSDGNLVLVGETSGRIQLMELKNKFALRQYSEHSNRVNCMDFAPDNRYFVSCANETGIKLFDIQNSDSSAELSIVAAHSDNVKRVQFYKDQKTLLSASSDSTVKLWDLRNTT